MSVLKVALIDALDDLVANAGAAAPTRRSVERASNVIASCPDDVVVKLHAVPGDRVVQLETNGPDWELEIECCQGQEGEISPCIVFCWCDSDMAAKIATLVTRSDA